MTDPDDPTPADDPTPDDSTPGGPTPDAPASDAPAFDAPASDPRASDVSASGGQAGSGTGREGRGARSGASPRSGWGAGRGEARANQDAYEAGATVRALRDLDELRRELRRGLSGTRAEMRRELQESLREPLSLLSELMPRLDHLERLLAAAGPAAAGTESPGAAADRDHTGEGTGDDDEPAVTPATGWDAMDRATAEQAWTALAEFVDTVLYRQYRLSRLQIPDCWPVHPRMVRELAWLRSSYLEAQDAEAEAPAASLPWHTRAIPGFLINTAEAVDVRECRPGVHRLTDPEVSRYATQRMTARHEGRPEPVLTSETGPDRPQLHPQHYPTRGTSTAAAPQDGAEPKPPTVTALPELLVGPCHPEHWIGYYREASAADLEHRDDHP